MNQIELIFSVHICLFIWLTRSALSAGRRMLRRVFSRFCVLIVLPLFCPKYRLFSIVWRLITGCFALFITIHRVL
jgi:hypothetical protein